MFGYVWRLTPYFTLSCSFLFGSEISLCVHERSARKSLKLKQKPANVPFASEIAMLGSQAILATWGSALGKSAAASEK